MRISTHFMRDFEKGDSEFRGVGNGENREVGLEIRRGGVAVHRLMGEQVVDLICVLANVRSKGDLCC